MTAPTGFDYASLAMAGMSMVFGFLGGKKQDAANEAIAAAQYKMAWDQYDFNWAEVKDQYTFNVESTEIAKWNLEQQRKYRDATAMAEWIDKDKQRLFDYNNQVDAYNASVEAMGEQLDFNDVAAQLATSVAKRAYQDELTLMGYQLEEQDIQLSKVATDIDRKRRGLRTQRVEGVKSTQIQREKLRLNIQAKQAEYKNKIEESRLQGLELEGKVRSTGRVGRSTRKNLTTLVAKQSLLEQALGEAMYQTETSGRLDMDAINLQLESLGGKLDLEDEGLMEQLYNTRVETEFGTRQLSDQLKSTNLQYESDEQKRKLEEYSADVRAREMLAAKPILAPQLSKPLELPTPVLQKPKFPRKGPEPIKYAPSTGHGLAGLAAGASGMSSALASFPT